MSTTPRIPVADFREAFSLQPDLFDSFWALYSTMWMDGEVDHPTKEIVRLRNARVTDCGYCKRVRFSVAREQGLTEQLVDQVGDGYSDSLLEPRHVALLRWVDHFLHDPSPLTPEMSAELAAWFSSSQMVELGVALAMFMGFAKMLISLGLEPEEMPTTVVATPGSAAR